MSNINLTEILISASKSMCTNDDNGTFKSGFLKFNY